MTSVIFVLVSLFANAQSVEQTPMFVTDPLLKSERQGTTYRIRLSSKCSYVLDAEWTKFKPDISLHFKDVCYEKPADDKVLAAYGLLLEKFRESHQASLVKNVSSGHMETWTARIVEVYLKEPVDPKEAPSYKRYAQLFNERDVGREWVGLLKKYGISVRLESIEKMFRSKPTDERIIDLSPELKKRKSSIPVGAGIYWFTTRLA